MEYRVDLHLVLWVWYYTLGNFVFKSCNYLGGEESRGGVRGVLEFEQGRKEQGSEP